MSELYRYINTSTSVSSRTRCVLTYRLELTFLKDPGEDEAAQRHRHDEDEGERQGGHGRFHHPQGHDARQLDYGEHVHTPRPHLRQQTEGSHKDAEGCRQGNKKTTKLLKTNSVTLRIFALCRPHKAGAVTT